MTVTDIFNLALAELSHDVTIAEGDGSQESARCALFYPRARLDVFTRHPWLFLQTTCPAAAVAGMAAEPGYAHVYAAPADALLIADCLDEDGQTASFIRRGSLIHTDIPIHQITYTQDADDPSEWPEPVLQAVVRSLAAKLCKPMAQNARITADAFSSAEEALSLAKLHDARANQRSTSLPRTAAHNPYKTARN